jgi:SRSO17 transposase
MEPMARAVADGNIQAMQQFISDSPWSDAAVIEECRGELGFDHYEVRGWCGWHHHTALSTRSVSHHFLVQLRLDLGVEAPALIVSQVRRRLPTVLPKREFEVSAVLDELKRIQQQNYAAYRSPRTRRRHKIRLQSSLPNSRCCTS